MVKWIVGILVLAGAGLFMWQSGWLGGSQVAQQAAPQPQAQAPAQQPQAQAPASGLPTADNDASDAALTQDTAALDTQIGSLNTDSATIDQSMNDKPVTQSY